MGDDATGPERPRSRRIRNAALLGVLMIGTSLGIGVFVGGAIEEERHEQRIAEASERWACDAERRTVEEAVEAGRAQTGRILGVRELQFIGLLAEPPRRHQLVLEGSQDAPTDYEVWPIGRCEEVADR